MAIQGLNSNYLDTLATASGSGLKDKTSLGQEDFLTLLVEQLKNQDPLNPMQGAEFTAQLAQFSSLEQLVGVNESLEAMQATMATPTTGSPLDYIGKTVRAADDGVAIRDGEAGSASYTIEGNAQVDAYLFDQWGNQVRHMAIGNKNAGEYDLNWDGRDAQGRQLADGNYRLEVVARNGNGTLVPSTTYLTGEVTGVTYEGDVAWLTVGSKQISTSQVTDVRQTQNDS